MITISVSVKEDEGLAFGKRRQLVKNLSAQMVRLLRVPIASPLERKATAIALGYLSGVIMEIQAARKDSFDEIVSRDLSVVDNWPNIMFRKGRTCEQAHEIAQRIWNEARLSL